MEVLKYFGFGWGILVIAILVNVIAKYAGISTWYDYITNMTVSGIKEATLSLSFAEVVFLYVIYPGIFGLIVYFGVRLSG